MEEKNDKSPHVLSASSNLLGLCFIVLTSLRVLHLDGKTIIDECTAAALVMFMVSSILSFLSMRSKKAKSDQYEKIADIIFLLGLFFLFTTTMLVTFNIIK
jgi:predicted transporter